MSKRWYMTVVLAVALLPLLGGCGSGNNNGQEGFGPIAGAKQKKVHADFYIRFPDRDPATPPTTITVMAHWLFADGTEVSSPYRVVANENNGHAAWYSDERLLNVGHTYVYTLTMVGRPDGIVPFIQESVSVSEADPVIFNLDHTLELK